MSSPERSTPKETDLEERRLQLVEQHERCLEHLHVFSESVRELGAAGGDPIRGTRGVVLDLCAAIETFLDHDLTRIARPEHSEMTVDGAPYDPDALALATLDNVRMRLKERVEASNRERPPARPS